MQLCPNWSVWCLNFIQIDRVLSLVIKARWINLNCPSGWCWIFSEFFFGCTTREPRWFHRGLCTGFSIEQSGFEPAWESVCLSSLSGKIISLPQCLVAPRIDVKNTSALSGPAYLQLSIKSQERFHLQIFLLLKIRGNTFDVLVDLPIETSLLLCCQIPQLIQRINHDYTSTLRSLDRKLHPPIQATCVEEIGKLSLIGGLLLARESLYWATVNQRP